MKIYAKIHEAKKEIFKDIVGYEGIYQVSNLGNVKTLSRMAKHFRGGEKLIHEKELKQNKDGAGYLCVGLYLNGKQIKKPIHRIVAECFLNPIQSNVKIVVDHIDNNKYNNKVENLQYITHRENTYKEKVNKGKFKGVTGVSFSKIRNKYVSAITINGIKKHLGYFETQEQAGIAYKNELINNNNIK